jgi:Mce-associated membrane protein
MEGDAGASRLTPDELDDSPSSEVIPEDSASETTAEDSTESEDSTDHEISESDADELSEADADEDATDAADDERGSSRLGRAWLIGIAAALVVLAGGVGAGGYFAWRSNQESRTTARHDEAAVAAAKSCVAATQAPDTNAMAASAQKMIDCGAGAFRSQAILYSSLLVEAYQAANAHVQVSDLRAAVERNNPDGSIDVLVPLRVKVSNTEAQDQETGYRLRVTMVNEDGQYRISKLDQVAR